MRYSQCKLAGRESTKKLKKKKKTKHSVLLVECELVSYACIKNNIKIKAQLH